MKEQFVTYELALKLKNLGFNEDCFAVYYDGVLHEHGAMNEYLPDKTNCSAPLWQQAFDWFRKEHNILGFVSIDNSIIDDGVFGWRIEDKNGKSVEVGLGAKNSTYEETREVCLDGLIRIVKYKQ